MHGGWPVNSRGDSHSSSLAAGGPGRCRATFEVSLRSASAAGACRGWDAARGRGLNVAVASDRRSGAQGRRASRPGAGRSQLASRCTWKRRVWRWPAWSATAPIAVRFRIRRRAGASGSREVDLAVTAFNVQWDPACRRRSSREWREFAPPWCVPLLQAHLVARVHTSSARTELRGRCRRADARPGSRCARRRSRCAPRYKAGRTGPVAPRSRGPGRSRPRAARRP